jgi:uncharacterized protein
MEAKPVVDAESAPFWEGVARGELRLQRCAGCGRAVFHPRAVCPHCFGDDLAWFAAAGTGTIYSYTVAHQAFGEFAGQVPFVVALVDLDEGVRMLTRIAGTDPGEVRIGQRVRVRFVDVGEPGDQVRLPWFEPA